MQLDSRQGIVCTLLKDEEVRQLRRLPYEEETLTEGIVFEVPSDLVEECLYELDFREKGGYARDIIDVVEDETKETVQALLYRGTPDNPAMWPRALRSGRCVRGNRTHACATALRQTSLSLQVYQHPNRALVVPRPAGRFQAHARAVGVA